MTYVGEIWEQVDKQTGATVVLECIGVANEDGKFDPPVPVPEGVFYAAAMYDADGQQLPGSSLWVERGAQRASIAGFLDRPPDPAPSLTRSEA